MRWSACCAVCPWHLLQESAGSYAYLRDTASLKVESPRPLDLTPEAASMLEKLMLAQAQVGRQGCWWGLGEAGGRVEGVWEVAGTVRSDMVVDQLISAQAQMGRQGRSVHRMGGQRGALKVEEKAVCRKLMLVLV